MSFQEVIWNIQVLLRINERKILMNPLGFRNLNYFILFFISNGNCINNRVVLLLIIKFKLRKLIFNKISDSLDIFKKTFGNFFMYLRTKQTCNFGLHLLNHSFNIFIIFHILLQISVLNFHYSLNNLLELACIGFMLTWDNIIFF